MIHVKPLSLAWPLLAAIDARDAAALTKAGGHLDEACEQCHLKYWYPNGGAPGVPAAR